MNHIGAAGRRLVLLAAIAATSTAAILAIASSADAATRPDAVVLVSGITTTTPFTTPTAQCTGQDPRGETWSIDGAKFAALGYRVYTAPVNYGSGSVQPMSWPGASM